MERGRLSLLSLHQRYNTPLAELQALGAANYARLLCLFVDYERSNCRAFLVGSAHVHMEIVERSRYTTIMRVSQQHGSARWLGHLRMELRAYHDARLVEIGLFQHSRSVKPRYRYPNREMHQPDEKFQQNRFLAEWLEHCLSNGRAVLSAAPVQQRTNDRG